MNEALVRFAKQDLRYARKNGEHLVARTLKGNITITYQAGIYILATFNLTKMATEVLFTGKRQGAIETMAKLYNVVAA